MSTEARHHDESGEELESWADQRVRSASSSMQVALWVGIVLAVVSTVALILLPQG